MCAASYSILVWALGLHSCPGTMASGYEQCMNYAEGLHFSAFHSLVLLLRSQTYKDIFREFSTSTDYAMLEISTYC